MSFIFGKRINTVTQAEKIASFQSTTCDFGTPLPIIYGRAKRSPNLINFQDFYAMPIETRQKTGKRSSSTQIDYHYYVYAELALCEGVIGGINRLWIGDQEYDSLEAFNANPSNVGSPLSLNVGDDPEPTTYMQTNHPEIAVGYGNMAYLYGYIFLGENSASIPSFQLEVNGQLQLTGDGIDANPADVIIDMLRWEGYADDIDLASFDNFRSYCRGAGLYVSTPDDAFKDQKKCQECIKELLQITNAYLFWSVDRFKIVPRDDRPRGSWQPNTTVCYDLTPDEMAKQDSGACVLYERKDSSEVYNRFGVVYTNRDNNYESETVYYEDAADIVAHGPRTAGDFSAKWLHTTERAVKLAEMQARINRTENIRYKFKLSWEFGLLEPGDLVTLTDPVIGLDYQLVMIESVDEESELTLSVTAVRREATAKTPEYDIPERTYNIVNYNADPDDVRAPLMIIPPADLVTSSSGLELWIALQGKNRDWGGCDVYASTKDGAYEMYGRHNRNSNYGKILTAMTSDSTTVDVEFTNVDTVEILEGSASDAENCLTDIWVNGECMAYTGSTLIGLNQYRLTGLIRGKYGTTAAAHAINDGFAVLDGNLFCVQLTKNLLDKILYLKFPSFNVFGNNYQLLNDMDYYNHRVRTYDIPNVDGLAATVVTHRHEEQQGYDPDTGDPIIVVTYTWDIVVRWGAPDWGEYNGGRVSYKASTAQTWTYAGVGASEYTISGIATPGTYNVAVATKDIKGNSETEDDSSQVTVTLSVPVTPS